jgi:hypothetical protein
MRRITHSNVKMTVKIKTCEFVKIVSERLKKFEPGLKFYTKNMLIENNL